MILKLNYVANKKASYKFFSVARLKSIFNQNYDETTIESLLPQLQNLSALYVSGSRISCLVLSVCCCV